VRVSPHTAQALDNAPCGTRCAPDKGHPSTLLRWSQPRNRRKLHRQECCTPPTCLLCFLKSVCQTSHVDQHQREVCRLSPWGDVAAGSIPIRPITERPSLAPSSSTRRRPGSPCGPLSQQVIPLGRRRAYHVSPVSQSGEGRASSPVVRQLRRGSSEPPDLPTYLLVQAYPEATPRRTRLAPFSRNQHLWLVLL
jgi:hypothetical protein